MKGRECVRTRIILREIVSEREKEKEGESE